MRSNYHLKEVRIHYHVMSQYNEHYCRAVVGSHEGSPRVPRNAETETTATKNSDSSQDEGRSSAKAKIRCIYNLALEFGHFTMSDFKIVPINVY